MTSFIEEARKALKNRNMKKIKIILLLGLVVCFACCKEDPPEPTPNIVLSESSVEMEIGENKSITISGGSKEKGYAFSPSTSDIVGIKLNGNRLELTAKKVGSLTILIKSADKTATLQVKVSEKPAPNLQGALGIYSLESNQSLFTSKYLAKNKNGVWFSPNVTDPYQKRAFLGYVSKADAQLGKTVSLKVRFPENNQTEERSVKVEKILGNSIQLLGETHRFVTEIK